MYRISAGQCWWCCQRKLGLSLVIARAFTDTYFLRMQGTLHTCEDSSIIMFCNSWHSHTLINETMLRPKIKLVKCVTDFSVTCSSHLQNSKHFVESAGFNLWHMVTSYRYTCEHISHTIVLCNARTSCTSLRVETVGISAKHTATTLWNSFIQTWSSPNFGRSDMQLRLESINNLFDRHIQQRDVWPFIQNHFL